ncbi:MAG: pyridoxamine 5'-phosphate oxidase family protein [Ferruginibacter sp.]
MLGELNQNQINNLLSSQVLGKIACSDGNQPYIVPVTYTFDGEYIYGQTNEGTKLEILRRNPKVCFEIDCMLNVRNWQSVIVYGKFEELAGEAAENARNILFNRVYPMMTSTTLHTYGHEEMGKLDDGTRVKTTMYRIKITNVTGRFERE